MRVVNGPIVFLFACLSACNATGRRDFRKFSIEVPRTWTSHVYGENEEHRGLYRVIGPGVWLEGPEGDYIDFADNPARETSAADIWLSARAGLDGKVTVEDRVDLCKAEPKSAEPSSEEFLLPPACMAGDGRLDAFVFFENWSRPYVVTFGNGRRERLEDLRRLRQVVDTIRLR